MNSPPLPCCRPHDRPHYGHARHPALRIGLACLVAAMLGAGCSRSVSTGDAPSGDSASAGVSSSPSRATDARQPDGARVETSHERMLALLNEIKASTASQHPYLGSGEANQLRQRLSDPSAGVPASVRWISTFRLAQLDLQLGNEREAIQGFLQCLERAPQVVVQPEKLTEAEIKVLFELGVAYMRYGETQNCCLRNSPESCILPIRGSGVHTNQDGSRQAVKCFTRICELTEPDDEMHRKARWLLNIAWMTLGEHPQSVPEAFRIPVEAFESSETFTRFTNIAQRLKLDTFSMSGGAIIDDFDNDHHLDLICSSWDPRDQVRFFRSRGDGTFEDRTQASGLEGFSGGLNMIQADYDNDGDTDFLILRGAWLGAKGRHPNSLMRNNGNGTFTDVTLDVGMVDPYPTQTAAWADYDNDGDLDLFVGNESDSSQQAPCQLYRNEGDGTFRDVAESAGVRDGGYAKGVVWGDVDGDRYPDLFVSNQGGQNRLFKNNRDGTFHEVAKQAGVEAPIQSFPAWFWDFDNDGKLDLYVSTYAASIGDLAAFYLGMESTSERSCLYRGDGKGQFENVADACGLTRPDASMGANFGDLDNDGYLDFYLGTGYPKYDSLMPSVMYRNRQGKRFVDITTAGGFGHLQKGHAVAFADLDHDGDQDVFEQMGGAFSGDRFHDALYENPGQGNHWITLKLVGSQSNRSAIGARIHVVLVEDGKTRSVYRHVNSGGSFGANPLQQTVGLGTAQAIERLEVYWPTSDKTQVFVEVPMDQHFLIQEDRDQLDPIPVQPFRLGGDG